MLAFFRKSKATNLSLSLASLSSRMLRSCLQMPRPQIMVDVAERGLRQRPQRLARHHQHVLAQHLLDPHALGGDLLVGRGVGARAETAGCACRAERAWRSGKAVGAFMAWLAGLGAGRARGAGGRPVLSTFRTKERFRRVWPPDSPRKGACGRSRLGLALQTHGDEADSPSGGLLQALAPLDVFGGLRVDGSGRGMTSVTTEPRAPTGASLIALLYAARGLRGFRRRLCHHHPARLHDGAGLRRRRGRHRCHRFACWERQC